MESEIVRVVSLSSKEISEITRLKIPFSCPDTLPTLKSEDFENIDGKGENAGNQHFLLSCSGPFILSSANALILDQSKICRLFNPFLNDKILDCSRLTEFADDNLKFD